MTGRVRDYSFFKLRLPAEARDRIKMEAKKNRRSMNTEMLARLGIEHTAENMPLAGSSPAYEAGLTKREHFAALIAAAFCSNPQMSELSEERIASLAALQATVLMHKLGED
jgi:hypothetical protein